MFHTVLIANRGEIACRIIKTLRRLGIESIAIYSTADRDSPHVLLADRAVCVGEPAARNSYLNIQAVIDAAIACNADAIHPGYGFLSENPALAEACAKAHIAFIGPSIEALHIMGSKQAAKQLLEGTNVPLTPGYHGADQSDACLQSEAIRLGFPILLKAASGGGGKGMRIVHQAADLSDALESARREAMAYFANDALLIEKLIENPRHIEVQIMADHHGQIVHLFERDCSIQRRYQKIIEEAPARHLPDHLRSALTDAAIAVARAIDYRGAGTVEFLVNTATDDESVSFYFMEMNTRLQVEHPVTELITGLDLVEWQLRIAANEPLPCNQSAITMQGYAMECRICAEDPHTFLPSIGQIQVLSEPQGDGIRVDSGIATGLTIDVHYDPMLSKLITWGDTRETARRRMQQALQRYRISGIKTNIPFLHAIVNNPRFINQTIDTHFLSEEAIQIAAPNQAVALSMAACFDYLNLTSAHPKSSLEIDAFGWQLHGINRYWYAHYEIQGEPFEVTVSPISPHRVALTCQGIRTTWTIKRVDQTLLLDDGTTCIQAIIETQDDSILVFSESNSITVVRSRPQQTAQTATHTKGQLTAPMPGSVVRVLKTIGDVIYEGEPLMVLEAMKMEHTIHAPSDGTLSAIYYQIGDAVLEGAQLVALETTPS